MAQLPQRADHQAADRRQTDDLPDNLQPIRLEHPLEKQQDRERDKPTINRRRDRIQREEHLVPLRQERIVRLLHPQAPGAQLAAQDRRRLLPQVRDFGEVGEDVIAVVPQQRVGIENQRAHRADEHYVQRHFVDEPWLAKPPDVGGNRGDAQLDVHPGRADRRPLPFIRQHPRVGDIAIQAGREHEHHEAQFMTFAAEMFAAQAVAKLVADLGHGNRHRQPKPVALGEELVEARQFCPKNVPLHEHQRQR